VVEIVSVTHVEVVEATPPLIVKDQVKEPHPEGSVIAKSVK
jgi:hypothetical protein